MPNVYSLRFYFFDFVTMLLVSGLSLFLLIYVGFGEAQRTYGQLHHEKLVAEGQIMQNAMEKVLRPGLPLKQYVGFGTLAQRILASDESISAIIAYDINGAPVFVSAANQSFEVRDGTCSTRGRLIYREDPGGSGLRVQEDNTNQFNFQAVDELGEDLPASRSGTPYCAIAQRLENGTVVQEQDGDFKLRN